MEQKHICGQCGKEFKTEKEYLEHKCKARDFLKPTERVEEENKKEE